MAKANRPRRRAEDILQALSTFDMLRQSVENGESVEQFKGKVRSNRGAIQKAYAIMRERPTTPEIRKLQMEEDVAWEKLSRRFDAFLKAQFRKIVEGFGDLDHWRTLAAKDRNQYRRELDEVLRGIKGALNHAVGIESHRQRENAERDKIIDEIKSSKPELSFGRVALEYKRRTGRQLTGKVAERSYKRHDALIQAEFEHWVLTLYHPEAVFPPVPQY